MSHDTLLALSQWQSALTAAMHITFPAVTVGTAMFVVGCYAMSMRTDDEVAACEAGAGDALATCSRTELCLTGVGAERRARLTLAEIEPAGANVRKEASRYDGWRRVRELVEANATQRVGKLVHAPALQLRRQGLERSA
jgi:hypothetical protein